MITEDAKNNVCPMMSRPTRSDDGTMNFVYCMGSECQVWVDWSYKAGGDTFKAGQGDCGLKHKTGDWNT